MDLESLKTKSAEALIGLIDSVKEAKDFVIAQIPDILRQLITYHMIHHGVLTALGLICAGASFWNFRKSRIHFTATMTEATQTPAAYGVYRLLMAFLLAVASYQLLDQHLFQFIKLVVAPKIWLIEYGAQLAKELRA